MLHQPRWELGESECSGRRSVCEEAVSCPLWLLCLHGKLTPEVHCVPKSNSSEGCPLLLTVPVLPGPGEAGERVLGGSRWPPHGFST